MPPSAPSHRQQQQLDVVQTSLSQGPSSHLARERNKLKGATKLAAEDSDAADDETNTPVSTSQQQQQQQQLQNGLASDNLNYGGMLSNSNTSSSLYNNSNMMNMYGGGGFGAGAYGGFTSPLLGGAASMMTSPLWYGAAAAGVGPLSSLNQMLFGVQTLIVSLGQAVQIIGMNTQALHQVVQSMTSMFDHAATTFYEMQQQSKQNVAVLGEAETEEMKKKRRRLQALRWALVMGVTYAAYRLIRRVFFGSQQQRANKRNYYLSQQQQSQSQHSPYYASDPNAAWSTSPPYYNSGAPYPNSYGSGSNYGYYGGGGVGGAMMQQPYQHGYSSSPSNFYGSPYSSNPYY